MDKGAHFHKCDFQVHTPRDRQWNGPEAITDVERKDLAKRYVLACRQKGLHAIAITDHHDTTFFFIHQGRCYCRALGRWYFCSG